MRISDWSSDVCSSDPLTIALRSEARPDSISLSIDGARWTDKFIACHMKWVIPTSACRYSNFLREIAASEESFMQQCTPLFSARTATRLAATGAVRSEEHTSELQSLMRISYAVFCLK